MAAHRVFVLALDGVLSFELGMPFMVLGSLEGLYTISVVSAGEDGVAMDSGLRLSAPGTLQDLRRADTVVVPGYAFQRGIPEAVGESLRACHARSARIVSLCVGAFALAESGLLTGRTATTHWLQTERLAREHPGVTVDRDVLFTDEGSVLTSAGTSAGIDLCLHLVRTDHGAAIANQAARTTVAAPHRDGGQAQFIERHLPDATGNSLAGTRAWTLEHLGEPLELRELAAHAHLSQRTFIRRFIAESGLPPMRWLQLARIDYAKELLERTDASVDEIARRSGLGTAANLRTHFARHCGLTPTAYRNTYAHPVNTEHPQPIRTVGTRTTSLNTARGHRA